MSLITIFVVLYPYIIKISIDKLLIFIIISLLQYFSNFTYDIHKIKLIIVFEFYYLLIFDHFNL
jgi:hypothetical protein